MNKNPPALFWSAKIKNGLRQLVHSYTDKYCDKQPRDKITPNWNGEFAPNDCPMKVQYKKLPYSLQGPQIHQKLVDVAADQPTERNVKIVVICQIQSLIHRNNGTLFRLPVALTRSYILRKLIGLSMIT